jgi:hypothetical protein
MSGFWSVVKWTSQIQRLRRTAVWNPCFWLSLKNQAILIHCKLNGMGYKRKCIQ